MSKVTLAVKYRPTSFNNVTEQDSIKIILQNQIDTDTFKHAYLFTGGAGTGKTTCARIFANEINKHKGVPVELDAASNSSVEDVRGVIQQSKMSPLHGGEYNIFIIDECHSLSNTAWQAFLKLIEEPPAKSIFIFCTTNPEKIPKTILSRVQRYDFKRISQQGIVDRLKYIIEKENTDMILEAGNRDVLNYDYEDEAVEYLAKLSSGGMRDAITLMDKCLSYSKELTVENIVKALGIADYQVMRALTLNYCLGASDHIIEIIEQIYSDGIELKQFIKQYINFVLDIKKYFILGNFDFITIPQIDENIKFLKELKLNNEWDAICDLLSILLDINAEIKYDSSPKYYIEAVLIGGIS